MRITGIVAALLIVFPCVANVISPPVLVQTYPWEYVEDANFVVFYREGDDANAAIILGYCQNAKVWVDPIYPFDYSELPGKPYDPTLDNPEESPPGFPQQGKMLVYLYDNNTWYVKIGYGEGTCYAESGNGILRFMSPANVSSEGRSWIDDDWYQKNVVHEYVHIPTWRDLLTTEHPIYDSVPYWFTEGTAEYISVFKTTPEIEEKYLIYAGYTETMEDAVIGGPLVFSGRVDSYAFVTYVVRYMYETYGNTMVSGLFKNSQGKVKFWDGVKTYLHVASPFEFEYRWNIWAATEFGYPELGRMRQADIDGSGVINILDVFRLAQFFGRTLPDP